jgi:hypothetical protein
MQSKQFGQAVAVANVQPVELEARPTLQLRQAPLLQAHVVGVVQVVHAHDGMAICQQELGDLRSDETGNAGNQVSSHQVVLLMISDATTNRFQNAKSSAPSVARASRNRPPGSRPARAGFSVTNCTNSH